MSQTSRERVIRALTFATPDRVPRELWTLPYVQIHHPQALVELERRFPGDFDAAPNVYRPSPRAQGDPFAVGHSVDEWGCRFLNIQAGVIGECKEPMLGDLAAGQHLQPPYEILPDDPGRARDRVNRHCGATDRFVRSINWPRPWERYQFLRGTENALLDVMEAGAEVRGLLRRIHEFYLKNLEFWVTTDVDAVAFMDDWGAQQQLLIPPGIWRELFKPLYRDYCDLARAHGKFVFMHSDGYIQEIYPDLVEIGVNALNSQVFCMAMPELARIARGRMTIWGEIDRQHVLVSPDPDVGRRAVREFCRHFHDPAGGTIAQFEFGPGAQPATALVLFDEWAQLT